MDTEKRFGLKKSSAVMLFFQMILTLILLVISIYLLIFVCINNLGGWMIASYIFISLSVISIIIYATIGYKKDDLFYGLSILPFLGAIFVNILLPQRNSLQIALLVLLFGLTIAFLLKQKNKEVNSWISYGMVLIALIFSVYSAIKADTQFLGPIANSWFTYASMYISIFVPTIMCGTLALTYKIRNDRLDSED